VRGDLADWHLAAVIAITSPGSALGVYLTGLLGPPSAAVGTVLAWRIR